MTLYRPEASVRECKTLETEYFQYKVRPPSWWEVSFSSRDITMAAATVLGVPVTEVQNEYDFSDRQSHHGKIVGFLGKYAVSIAFGFSADRLFSNTKRGYYDFYAGDKRVLVKTSGRVKNEVVMMDSKTIMSDAPAGPELIVAVNMNIDFKNLYYATAYVVGWCLIEDFKTKSCLANDIKGSPLFLRIPQLSAPKSLRTFIKFKESKVGN